MSKKDNLVGLGSGLFWGISTVVLGLALTKINIPANSATLTTTWIHDSMSAFLLIIIVLSIKKSRQLIKTIMSKSGLIIMGAALVGGPIGMGAYFIAINYLSPSIAASISALYPAFGVVLAYFLLSEKISRNQIFGLAISIGAIMLMSVSNQLTVSNLFLGLLSISLCVIGWGSEAVIISYAMKQEVDSTIALTIRQLTSAAVYGILIMPFLKYDHFFFIIKDNMILSLIAIASLFATVSYLLYYMAIDSLGASRAMALNISYPAWAFFFQLLLFQSFSISEFVLVLLILIGVYVGIKK